jgi:hypothetical protein
MTGFSHFADEFPALPAFTLKRQAGVAKYETRNLGKRARLGGTTRDAFRCQAMISGTPSSIIGARGRRLQEHLQCSRN